MKKTVFYTVLLVAVISLFCIGGCTGRYGVKEEAPSQTSSPAEGTDEQIPDMDAGQIPVSDVEGAARESENGLTAEAAEMLCGEVLGKHASETGFPISYKCIGGASYNGKLYYVMHISWFVNNQHWSYIGNAFVSSDGAEIYDGIVSEEEYEITGLRWKK